MVVTACVTHWYTSLAYVAPVLGVGGWLFFMNWRDKRNPRPQKPATAQPAPPHGAGAPEVSSAR
jgi:hypothetical protein